MIFLAHLSGGDHFVLSTMEESADSLLRGYGEWDPDRQCAFVNSLLMELPRLEASDGVPVENWTVEMRQRDEQLRRSKRQGGGENRDAPPASEDLSDDDLRAVLEANSAFKTVQIIGQVLRSYPGSLDGEVKVRLMHSCYRVVLRLLYFVYENMQNSGVAILDGLIRHVSRTRPEARVHELQSAAKGFLFLLCERITFGVIRHLSESVGSSIEELRQVYQEVMKSNEKKTPYRLIDLSIKFDHFDRIPIEPAVQLFVQEQRKKNRITAAVVRDIAWYHMYIFETSESTRQKLCDNLEIGKTGYQKLREGRGRLLAPPDRTKKRGKGSR